jgi:hypothetical protein
MPSSQNSYAISGGNIPFGEHESFCASSPEVGRIDVIVSEDGVTAYIADDGMQRNYIIRCNLADYATQVPTEGWFPIRRIIADDFTPQQRAEIEAYIAEFLRSSDTPGQRVAIFLTH